MFGFEPQPLPVGDVREAQNPVPQFVAPADRRAARRTVRRTAPNLYRPAAPLPVAVLEALVTRYAERVERAWERGEFDAEASELLREARERRYAADAMRAAAVDVVTLLAVAVVVSLARTVDVSAGREPTAVDTTEDPPPREALQAVRTIAPTRAPSLARVRATTAPE